jgi:hypothetical protein
MRAEIWRFYGKKEKEKQASGVEEENVQAQKTAFRNHSALRTGFQAAHRTIWWNRRAADHAVAASQVESISAVVGGAVLSLTLDQK